MTNHEIDLLIIVGLAVLMFIIAWLFTKKEILVPHTVDIQLDTMVPEASERAYFEDLTYANIDWLALQDCYKKLARKHKRKLKKTNGCVIAFLITTGAWLLGGLVSIFSNAITHNNEDGNRGVTVILGIFVYGAMLTYYLSCRNEKVNKLVLSKKYKQIANNKFPAIWAVCDNLMAKMDLNMYTFKMYYVKTNALEASVLVDRKEICLFLSRGLISLYQSDPKSVESILGHEFGHVYQGDTKMLLVNKSMLRFPAYVAMFSVLITLTQFIIAFFQGQGLPNAGGSSILVILYWSLVKLRLDGEYLADMASMSFVENSCLAILIGRYMPNESTINYPSSSKRLRLVAKILHRFRVTQTSMRQEAL